MRRNRKKRKKLRDVDSRKSLKWRKEKESEWVVIISHSLGKLSLS